MLIFLNVLVHFNQFKKTVNIAFKNGPTQPFKDSVLSIMHCALQKSAAIFLTLSVGLIALCHPFASAMSVVERLFMYLFYSATLKNVFQYSKFKETRSTRRNNFFPRN